MLRKRVLAALALAAVGIPAMIIGQIPYFILIALFLGLASWEYVHIFRKAQYYASEVLVLSGVELLLFARTYFPNFAGMVLAFLALAAMTWHLCAYERGRNLAATDFCITLGGILYLGWIGAYLIDLRSLDKGLWWLLLVLGSVWLADSSAYFIGGSYGKHKLCPRLSPKKTWEGYWAGLVVGTLGGVGLAVLFQQYADLNLVWWQGAVIGLVMSALPTLGDLGESMIKRQANLKDSSNIIPGHGGFLDRLDAWLWAAVLGYYLITWIIP